MAHELDLTRYGTARGAIAGAPGAASAEALEAGAARAAESFNLTPAEAALAAELADLEPELPAEERRALFALVLAVRVFLSRGSTRVPVGGADGTALEEVIAGLASEVPGLGRADEVVATIRRLLAEHRAPAVIGSPGDYRPLVHDAPYVCAQRVFACEEQLVGLLGRTLERPPVISDGESLDTAVAAAGARLPLDLSDEQTAAVRTALARPFSLITGGPGTGKTTIVAAILLALRELGVPAETIALAAPTGKAAWRLGDAVAQSLEAAGLAGEDPLRTVDSRTLHRLLGYLPAAARFRHHGQNPLPERVVIVDEASMIDVFLMERLVSAAREDGRLVLLGDADQLPSVDAGAVFRDLATAGEAMAGRVVRLEKSFRMRETDPAGRAILQTAAVINRGEVERLGESGPVVRRRSPAELQYAGVEAVFHDHEPALLRAFLAHWYESRIADTALEAAAKRTFAVAEGGIVGSEDRQAALALLDHHERSRVLCLTHGLRGGTAAANAEMHRRHQRFLERPAEFEVAPGEPVMMRVNDYDRNLFNGDAGVAVMGRDEEERVRPYVVFRRGRELAAFAFGPLRPHLELAWAQTVHKSQGSEFDVVAVLLPERDLPLLTRELLYTAVTRARRGVVLLGPEALLHAGVSRRIRRFSGTGAGLAVRRAGSEPPPPESPCRQ
jgi:exodeoxyribonuclease V alpha subunit